MDNSGTIYQYMWVVLHKIPSFPCMVSACSLKVLTQDCYEKEHLIMMSLITFKGQGKHHYTIPWGNHTVLWTQLQVYSWSKHKLMCWIVCLCQLLKRLGYPYAPPLHSVQNLFCWDKANHSIAAPTKLVTQKQPESERFLTDKLLPLMHAQFASLKLVQRLSPKRGVLGSLVPYH